MSARDDAIAEVEAALIGYGYAGDEIVERRTKPADWDALTVAQITVEAAEPIIRADERAAALEFCCNDTRPQIEAEVREAAIRDVLRIWADECSGFRNVDRCQRCRAFNDVLTYALGWKGEVPDG